MGVREDALLDQDYEEQRYQCFSIEEAGAHINSLTNNVRQLQARVRYMEDLFDTYFDTPLWKRLLFVIDGWPMDGITNRPNKRPWRRWWTS